MMERIPAQEEERSWLFGEVVEVVMA